MSRRRDRQVELGVLAGLVVIVAAVGIGGSALTLPQIATWYEVAVVKPSFTPPNWVFGPVWTVLYVMMAAAAWLVWRETGWHNARRPFVFWTVQLALNLAWSWLFFDLHRVGWSLAEIAVLAFAIVMTMREFHRFSRPAAWLLAPYLAWVGFAAILNFSIWQLNP